MLESVIEKAVVKYAREKGFLALKWSSPHRRGVHDHIFFKNGVAFSIEFKAPGKKATKLQTKLAVELAEQSIPSRCIDTLVEGRAFINDMAFCIENGYHSSDFVEVSSFYK